MSWEDQGRQEHGWFGHGTSTMGKAAPSQSELRSRLAATVELAAAALALEATRVRSYANPWNC